MPNYPEQYFNQNITEPQGFSNLNKVIVKEEIVSGSSNDKIYVAQLVKIVGTGVSLSTGDISVDLTHVTDSVRLGNATNLTNVTPGGHLFVSGLTQIANADNSRVVSINSDNSLKISGGTVLYDSGSTRSVNVLSNNALKISGSTQISDGSSVVGISGTSLQVLATNSEAMIGAVVGLSIKPTKVFARPNNATQYGIGDILSNNSSTPLEFVVSRANNKSVFCIGGKSTSAVSASTAPNINLLLFDNSFTIAADNNLLTLSGGNAGSMSGWVGTVKFSTWDTISNSMYSQGITESPFVIVPSGGTQNIYGIPIFANTYTPAANEVFSFSLEIDQN